MKQITTIGLDLAKNVFQVHGAADDGSPIFNKKTASVRVAAIFREIATVSGRHGSLRRFALLGARNRGAGSRGAPDSAQLM